MRKLFMIAILTLLLAGCADTENDVLESSSYQNMKLTHMTTTQVGKNQTEYWLEFTKNGKTSKFEVPGNIYRDINDIPNHLNAEYDFIADDDEISGIALSKTRK